MAFILKCVEAVRLIALEFSKAGNLLLMPVKEWVMALAVMSRASVRPVGVQLVVENIDRSARFYRGVLELRTVRQGPGVAQLAADDGGCALVLREIPGGVPREPARRQGVTLRFEVDSRDALDRMCERLVRAGSRVSPHQEGSRRSVFATDPDGHALEAFHDGGAA
jgi:catechol-2,3-dioxygenase